MLGSSFLTTLVNPYTTTDGYTPNPTNDSSLTVTLEPRKIDTDIGGPYAGYNWELLYHMPVAVAVHLSNNQRFAEAQKWFHLVFDPTSTDLTIRRAAALLEVLRLQRRRRRWPASNRCSTCSSPPIPAQAAAKAGGDRRATTRS